MALKMKRKVFLDTSFILNSLKYKIDMLSELNRILDFNYDIYIVDKTLDELKDKKYEKLALKILEKVRILNTDSLESVDNLLLEQKDGVIATQDKALKEKLKNRHIPVITIRKKQYFVINHVL